MGVLTGDDRTTGSSGGMIFEDPVSSVGQVFIPITYWSCRCDKSMQDITNSANYHRNTGLVYPTQVQVAIRVEGLVRGRFRLQTVPGTIIRAMFSGEIIPEISLYVRLDYKFGTGQFHITGLEMDNPIDDIVNYECRITSYGLFVPTTSAWTPPVSEPFF